MKEFKHSVFNIKLIPHFVLAISFLFFQSNTSAEETYWAGCINSNVNYYLKAKLKLADGSLSGEIKLLKYDLVFSINGKLSNDNRILFSINVFELDKPQFSVVINKNVISGTVKGNLLNGNFYLKKYIKLPSNHIDTILGWYKLSKGNDVLITSGGNSDLSLVDLENDKQYWLLPETESKYFELSNTLNSTVSLSIPDQFSNAGIYWNDGNESSVIKKVKLSYRQKQIDFTSGETFISGTLHFQDVNKKQPLIILIQGSGSAVKDDYYYLQLAGFFINKGFAVFLSDKRGSGTSGGSWHNASYSELAYDISAAVDELIRIPVIDKKNIIVFGFSQGGVLAPMVSVINRNISMVINCMGTVTTAAEQELFDIENECSNTGYDMEKDGKVEQLYSKLFDYARTSQGWDEYQNLALSAASKQWYICAGFPPLDSADWRIKFWKANVNSDGAEAWKFVTVPSLVIYGEDDTNVPSLKCEKIIKEICKKFKKKNIELMIFEGLGHIITLKQLEYINGWILENLQN